MRAGRWVIGGVALVVVAVGLPLVGPILAALRPTPPVPPGLKTIPVAYAVITPGPGKLVWLHAVWMQEVGFWRRRLTRW